MLHRGLSIGCSSFREHRYLYVAPVGAVGKPCSNSSSSSDPGAHRAGSHCTPPFTSSFCPFLNLFSPRHHQLSCWAQPYPMVQLLGPAGAGQNCLCPAWSSPGLHLPRGLTAPHQCLGTGTAKPVHQLGHTHCFWPLLCTVYCTSRGSILRGTTGEAFWLLPNAQLAGAGLPGRSYVLLAHRRPKEPGKVPPSPRTSRYSPALTCCQQPVHAMCCLHGTPTVKTLTG